MEAAPAAAGVVAAPTLSAPAAAASSVEGGSLTFRWSGTLQGDPDARDRSFFLLELAKAADVPAGAQAPWPQLENSAPTEPGGATRELKLGAPEAGSYRWRVCAWGVIDDVNANEIVQLPGGCSAARTLTTTAVVEERAPIGELTMETQVAAPGKTVTVYRERPAAAAPVTPAPAAPAPQPAADPQPVTPVVEQPQEPISHGSISRPSVADEGSSVGLGGDSVPGAGARDIEGGFGAALARGLSSNLPILPIPFWTLALLLACLPLAQLWRRDVRAMFEWPDGSIDGRGEGDQMLGEFATVPVAQALKVGSRTADAAATAPTHPLPGSSARGHRAA